MRSWGGDEWREGEGEDEKEKNNRDDGKPFA